MRDSKGALVYGGWRSNSVNFVGVFSSYCAEKATRFNSKQSLEYRTRITLIAVSPMDQIEENEEENGSASEETASFNAEAYISVVLQCAPLKLNIILLDVVLLLYWGFGMEYLLLDSTIDISLKNLLSPNVHGKTKQSLVQRILNPNRHHLLSYASLRA